MAGESVHEQAPAWRTEPVTPERFEDFADVVDPHRRFEVVGRTDAVASRLPRLVVRRAVGAAA